jgi:hypothetical protein
MPSSNEQFKDAIFQHIKFIAGYDPRIRILDVGAGMGTYAKGLPELKMDALEIHDPYINEFDLPSLYNNVYNGDILNFDYSGYDYIIMGDVLEHITKENAIPLINDISNKKIKLIVGVPHKMPQSSKFTLNEKEWDVHSEIHHQADLTPRVMKSRYPSLEMFVTNNFDSWGYAYYINYYKRIF